MSPSPRVAQVVAGLVTCAALTSTGACVALFESLDPQGTCAPFSAQSLPLDEATRAGYSGQSLLSAAARSHAFEVLWRDGPTTALGLELIYDPDVRFDFEASEDPKSRCDREISNARVQVEMEIFDRLEPATRQRFVATVRPLSANGSLRWVSVQSAPEVWNLPGAPADLPVQLRLVGPVPGPGVPGESLGRIEWRPEACEGEEDEPDDGRETGDAGCAAVTVADLFVASP